MTHKPWRVQAILLPTVTNGNEAPYRPSYYRFKWQARRQEARLRRSFRSWMVRIEVERA